VRSDRTLRKWYREINRRFFTGNCPERVCLRYARAGEEKKEIEESYFGWADSPNTHTWPHNKKNCPNCRHDFEIVLDEKAPWVSILSTLAHEMIHLATNMKDDHGPAFEEWRQYISDRGIFKKHALYKGHTLF
jgi:SprT-like family